MQDQIFNLILEQEDVTWKTILYDLVKSEEMDPWDVNVTALTQKYLQVIKKMKEHDLKVSGKVLLAAAILLKIKSTHLVDNDLANLDRLINAPEDEGCFAEFFEEMLGGKKEKQKFQLIPKNPQPRNRKVSIHDLVEALQRAMATKKKILARYKPAEFKLPENRIDIMEVIKDLYHKINYYAKKEEGITFQKLLPPRAGRREKVYTFIPLLHLENEQKIETTQQEHFGEIQVKLVKK